MRALTDLTQPSDAPWWLIIFLFGLNHAVQIPKMTQGHLPGFNRLYELQGEERRREKILIFLLILERYTLTLLPIAGSRADYDCWQKGDFCPFSVGCQRIRAFCDIFSASGRTLGCFQAEIWRYISLVSTFRWDTAFFCAVRAPKGSGTAFLRFADATYTGVSLKNMLRLEAKWARGTPGRHSELTRSWCRKTFMGVLYPWRRVKHPRI